MVYVVNSDLVIQADVVFVIEATAVNGAYIADIKTNYIIPSLEYFNQGTIDESSLISDNSNCLYGIVTYQAADCLPCLTTDTFGPFTSPAKVLGAIERLELVGGKGESHANIAEGLATALCCFEELQLKRDPNIVSQRHCILICNSPSYAIPVLECQSYSGKNAEQLAQILQEKSINLSVISPRKIPPLYKLFEKSGGDLTSSQTKNYAKDPRHLVLLKGFSLKERPVSPPPGAVANQPPMTLPVASMPSPLPGNDSPIHNTQMGTPQNPNMMGNNSPTVVNSGMGQSPVYRSPSHPQGRLMPQNPIGIGMQGMPAPPGYHASTGGARPGWQMPPPTQQPRAYNPQQTPPATGSSALLAQLNQPPSMTGQGPFGQINTSPSMGKILNPQATLAQNPTSMAQPQVLPNQSVVTQAQGNQQPAQVGARERHTIWHGVLEWIEKPKSPGEQQKVTKHVPCQVSSNSKDGEPEMKADGWPPKLIMQLMPKQLIGNIGGSYLKNSKSVLFHPTQCDALESLTRVMNSGFAGCVHFTSNPNPTGCDIKVLILLYTSDKKAYLGFIPNDQGAFVERLRKVIQQQKIQQRPGPGGNGQPSQMQAANPVAAQQQNPAQNMLIQGQPGGSLVPPTPQPQPNPANMQMMGQPAQQGPMMGQPVQRAPFENQLQAERQHNLEKINQLKQTLEAAQQQEQQYKSQLERISHMKTSHLQEALQAAQQTEMHYKIMEQRMAQGNPQVAQPNATQQQRMIRPPVMANNPGLRHLLQQQPQYRQQMINMQQMGGNGRGQMGQQQMPQQQGGKPQQFDDVSNFDFNNIM